MTVLSGKELYVEFLESAWWKELSARKKAIVGRCEKCGARNDLQSHHIRYRASWFDTVLEDLQVLCRVCHEREHKGIEQPKYEPAKMVQGQDLSTLEGLRIARSCGELTPERYKQYKRMLGAFQNPRNKKFKGRRRRC